MSYAKRNQGRGGRRSPQSDQLTRIERKVDELLRRSGIELEMEFEHMLNVDKLVAEVEETQGAAASTKVLIKGLYTEIRALKVSDPAAQAKIDELASKLQAAQDELASAVEAEAPGGSTGGIPPTE